MENLHMIVALCGGVAASLALVLPFFNRELKDELAALGRQKAELEAAAERFEKRLQEKDNKLQKLREALEAAEKDAEEERRKGRGPRGDGRKVQDLERDFNRKEELLERRLADASSALTEVQAELLEQKQKVAKMGEELAFASAAAAQAKAALEKALATPPPPPPMPAAATAPAPEIAPAPNADAENELASLREAMQKLTKELKIRSHGEKTIKRKLEHNRRAYMVTMLQLDLANDELCLIKTGKPRRQTARANQQVPGSVPGTEVDEPETVEDLLAETSAEAEPVIDLINDPPALPEVAAEVEEEPVSDLIKDPPALPEVAAEVEEEPAPS